MVNPIALPFALNRSSLMYRRMSSLLPTDIFHTSVLLLQAHDDCLYLLSPFAPLNKTMDLSPSLYHTF